MNINSLRRYARMIAIVAAWTLAAYIRDGFWLVLAVLTTAFVISSAMFEWELGKHRLPRRWRPYRGGEGDLGDGVYAVPVPRVPPRTSADAKAFPIDEC